MQHMKFQPLSQEILMKKISEYFLCISMFQPRTPWREPSWALGPSFEQIKLRTTRQYFIPNFEYLSQTVLGKKTFKYCSFFNTKPHVAGPFWNPGLPSAQNS